MRTAGWCAACLLLALAACADVLPGGDETIAEVFSTRLRCGAREVGRSTVRSCSPLGWGTPGPTLVRSSTGA